MPVPTDLNLTGLEEREKPKKLVDYSSSRTNSILGKSLSISFYSSDDVIFLKN